jgi:hypothetical protein
MTDQDRPGADPAFARASELLGAESSWETTALPWMSPTDAALWRTARTLADLGKLTARWLEGEITTTPSHLGPPDSETTDLIPTLAAANRAGFVTDQSSQVSRSTTVASVSERMSPALPAGQS